MFDIGLDLLYFQPQEDNLAYAMKASTIETPNMRWGWGFRLDMGGSFKRDGWRMNLAWTCLPVQNDTEVSGHILPTWSGAPQTATSFVDKAKAHWRLHLGIVDLLLSKPWDVSSFCRVIPGIGVRYASLRQKFFVSYFGGNLFIGEEDTIHTKNKYEGVGPVASLSGDFSLVKSLSLTGSLDYSIVYGSTYVHQKEWEKGAHRTHFRLFEEFTMPAGLFHLALGLKWIFHQCELHAKWEQYFFPDQNHLMNPKPGFAGVLFERFGALSTAGVSGGAQWSF